MEQNNNLTSSYDRILYLDDERSIFFFAEKQKVGLGNKDNIILPAEYLLFTTPVSGFFFAVKELDEEYSRVFLYSLFDPNFEIIAVERKWTGFVLCDVDYGAYEIEVAGTEISINNIILVEHSVFDSNFTNLVSQEKPKRCHYDHGHWFYIDERAAPEEREIVPLFSDDTNYARETWYAMTDGMYGDYPGDVDYDDLGF